MKESIKALFFIVLGLFSLPLLAAAKLDYLNVDGDIVYFSTEEAKSHTLPSCVTAGNEALYSLSLRSHSGRAIYTLLMTAMASNQAVTVISALACNEMDGFESAKKLEVVPMSSDLNSSAASVVTIYKSDGVTKVGKFIEAVDTDTWLYADINGGPSLLELDNGVTNLSSILFLTSDCTGKAFYWGAANSGPYVHKAYKDGRLLKLDNSYRYYTYRSKMGQDSVCHPENYSGNRYELLDYEHPVCDSYQCVLK